MENRESIFDLLAVSLTPVTNHLLPVGEDIGVSITYRSLKQCQPSAMMKGF